ncbi:hypothetical protein EDC04DRAFT_1802590 [Pisolithus marmoratus]|nr:hypothetical protein EDC04DRAFT_1802590 [Pisolithus marmoratus]
MQTRNCVTRLHDAIGDSWMGQKEPRATPKWFSRGWTLQELIAPKVVRFFDQKWEWIGEKAEFVDILSEITRIPGEVLTEGLEEALSSAYSDERPSVAQIMSWASDRATTREEDRAHSLLGLLGVHMPMLYGEGKNAFRRLQLEIIRMSNDQSIFAWGWTRQFGWSNSILADDPSCFKDCNGVTALKPEQFSKDFKEKDMPDDEPGKSNIREQLRTFTVTNDGMQIRLPTATAGPFSQVTLACCRKSGPDDPLITLHLVIRGSTCFRVFGRPDYPVDGKVEFKQHLLPYKEAKYPSPFIFELQDQALSRDAFVLDRGLSVGAEVKDGLVTLSSDNDFAAIAYVRGKDDTRFLVLLSYFFGNQPSAVAILAPTDLELAFLRSRALERLFANYGERHDKYLMQHIHFRRSIEGVRVIHMVPYGALEGCTVTIDIAKCSGCCTHEQHPTRGLMGTL